MIKTTDGTELRNLEEQVLKNTQDIAKHWQVDRVLADWGIQIVGKINDSSELPDPALYKGKYGDAYVVGVNLPYVYYIWTRANESTGQANDYWLNIGTISVTGDTGPQGPIGPAGPQGVPGSKWYTGSSAPTNTGSYKENDCFLNTSNGYVYQYVGGGWDYKGSIRGPQGIQGNIGPQGPQGNTGPIGPQGPQGPAGEFITIVGELSSSSQLPSPSSVSRSAAYLIPDSTGTKHVWLISGTDSNLTWIDAGSFGEGGTTVQVNGSPVSIWDADTKLTKITSAGTYTRAYTVSSSGTVQSTTNISNSAVASSLALRDGYGNLKVNLTPNNPGDAASKQYVDNKLATNHVDKSDTPKIVYGTDINGQQITIPYSGSVVDEAIVARGVDGDVIVPLAPGSDTCATSKRYVDTGLATKVDLPTEEDEIDNRMPIVEKESLDVIYKTLGDIIAPVGRIIMTLNEDEFQNFGNVWRHKIYGGQWNRIESRFLVGVGAGYAINQTGGYSDSVVVSHSHSGKLTIDGSLFLKYNAIPQGSGASTTVAQVDTTTGNTAKTATAGVSGTGRNIPPYYAVYIWKRIA